MDDPYLAPSGVLRNRLGISDPAQLNIAEADISNARLTMLHRSGIKGSYDLAHLQAFHAFIFGDVYDWAGQLRTVDIAKPGSAFCRREHIAAYAEDVFSKLKRAAWPHTADRHAFIEGLADTYADINALHPFREGNGRAQRAFLQQLVRETGRTLSWVGLDAAENETASMAGFQGRLEPLIEMFDKHVLREG